jgi:hypothetical protein
MASSPNDPRSRRLSRSRAIRISIVGGFGVFVIASMWIGSGASAGWIVAGTLGGAICVAVAAAEVYLWIRSG